MDELPEIDILKAKRALAKAQKKKLEYFQLESKIEEKVSTYAKSKGVLSYKFTSPNKRSVPDRLFVFPGGRVVFMELKQLGKPLTDNQERECNKLLGAGAEVYLCDSSEVGKLLIDYILEDLEEC